MHGIASFDLPGLYAHGRHVIFADTCARAPREQLMELLTNGHTRGWGHEHARQLLQFCTAFSVLPPEGHPHSLGTRPIRVLSVPPGAEGGGADNTPTASTCGRELYLPVYGSVEKMMERFEKAFEHMQTSGFGYA